MSWREDIHRAWAERHPNEVDEEIKRIESFIDSMRTLWKRSDPEKRVTIMNAVDGFVVRLRTLEEWRKEQCTKMKSE